MHEGANNEASGAAERFLSASPRHLRQMCAKAGIRARKSWCVAFPGWRPVAFRHTRTRLPLRGQLRHSVPKNTHLLPV